LLSDCPIFGSGSYKKFATGISRWARLTGKFASSERYALPSPNRIKTAKHKQPPCCPSQCSVNFRNLRSSQLLVIPTYCLTIKARLIKTTRNHSGRRKKDWREQACSVRNFESGCAYEFQVLLYVPLFPEENSESCGPTG
jgi:hypothetical protein